jgi:hypothetical protein
VDITIVSVLAINGVLMAPLSFGIVASLFAAAALLAIVLDTAKVALFGRLRIA